MLNKKRVLMTMAILGGITTTTGIANAGTYDSIGCNLGAELSLINKPSIKQNFRAATGFKKNRIGANLFLGVRFNESFGSELGYGWIAKTKEHGRNNANQGVTATNKVKNIYIDALAYLPVNSKSDLIGAIGLGGIKSKLSMPGPSAADAAFINSANKRKIGVRVGLGTQYNFCKNWSGRAMVRYQDGNKNFLKSNVSVTMGGVYTF